MNLSEKRANLSCFVQKNILGSGNSAVRNSLMSNDNYALCIHVG